MSIKNFIKEQGWTITSLADAMGVPRPSLQRSLSQNQTISSRTLKAMADAMELPVETLENEMFNDGGTSDDTCNSQAKLPIGDCKCTASSGINGENIPGGLVETLLLAVAGLNKRLDAIEEKVDALNCKNAIFSEAFGENKNGKNTIEKIEELHSLMDALYKRIDDMEDKDDSGFSATAPADVRKKIALLPHRFDLFGAKLDEVRSEVTEMLNKCKADGYDVKAMKETMQANALELERIRKISTAGHEEVMGYLEGLTDDHKQMMDKADPNAGRDW